MGCCCGLEAGGGGEAGSDAEAGGGGEAGGDAAPTCDPLLSPHPVYACKLSDREHPLHLRLAAGPRTDTLSFVLCEHEIGEVSP